MWPCTPKRHFKEKESCECSSMVECWQPQSHRFNLQYWKKKSARWLTKYKFYTIRILQYLRTNDKKVIYAWLTQWMGNAEGWGCIPAPSRLIYRTHLGNGTWATTILCFQRPCKFLSPTWDSHFDSSFFYLNPRMKECVEQTRTHFISWSPIQNKQEKSSQTTANLWTCE